MEKYLLFIDVDGTLIKAGEFGLDKRIPSLFERLKSDGHVVAVVSGRALNSILEIKGLEKANYLCGLMGCIAIDSKTKEQVIKPKPMNKNIVKKFINDIEAENLKWIYKDKAMQKTYFNDPELNNKFSPTVVETQVVLSDVENSNVFQILVDGKIPETIINKYSDFEFIEMPENYYDVISKGATKARIVKHLKKVYKNHISVAIGDSANDIEMFKNCKIRIAMGEAKEELKKISTNTTKNVEDRGVVYAIENILKL